MTDGTYTGQGGYDRNEMFAIGAATGALIATAVQEMIERRRRKSPIERASERVSAVAGEGTKLVGDLTENAAGYFSGLSKQSRKAARKKSKRARKQTMSLKDAAAGALGAVAASNVVDKALELTESARHATMNGKTSKANKARDWWQTASETAQGYVGAARETVMEEEARLAERAREAASVARERLEDAHLGERAREVAAVASGTIKDVAGTARERLAEADLGPKAREYAGVAAVTVKDYSTKASKAARTGAEKLGESAAHVAESTAEGAKDLQMGVKKSVKQTRRRVTWGIRAFIIGLVIGILTAPQSGQRTRDTVQGFVQDLLDLVLPDDQMGGATAH
jgi:hypothetical protein